MADVRGAVYPGGETPDRRDGENRPFIREEKKRRTGGPE